jgi:branched-chain amino acid transport system substrate-binding protein
MLALGKYLPVGIVAVVLLTETARADIVIAVAGPMTGQYAEFGEQMRKGARQAVRDLNQSGGVLGQRIVLRIGDDRCDPGQAIAVANQLDTSIYRICEEVQAG